MDENLVFVVLEGQYESETLAIFAEREAAKEFAFSREGQIYIEVYKLGEEGREEIWTVDTDEDGNKSLFRFDVR